MVRSENDPAKFAPAMTLRLGERLVLSENYSCSFDLQFLGQLAGKIVW